MKIEIDFIDYITARAARPRQPMRFMLSVGGASGGNSSRMVHGYGFL
jgi:hypothetical protein